MDFKTKAKVTQLFKSGQGKQGPWYLYRIQEQAGRNTKTWSVFTNIELGVLDEYELSGYISESPNKSYQNQAGKHPYQTTFNVTNAKLVGYAQEKQFNDNEPPRINQDDEIPF